MARGPVTPGIPARPALFLDVDGTLLPIAPRPADAQPDAELLELIERLQRAAGGAVALLSGRPLQEVAAMFAPLALALAGTHGLERRRADGTLVRATNDRSRLNEARAAVERLIADDARLFIEDKGEALAVHYRMAPELAPHLERCLSGLAQRLGPSFHVQPGAFVFELKPAQPNKGAALLEFMQEAPFRDRIPIAAGDDLTDLFAFRAAESLGGHAIAVGGRVQARWHLPDPQALRAWLDRLIDELGVLSPRTV